ncbi:MAG: HNH endonuclease [Geitlerinemataceae cyanobacterium]
MNTKQKRRKKQQLIHEYGYCCWWCRKALLYQQLTIEHLKPKSKGGSNNLENLRLACSPCNQGRRDSLYPPEFWLLMMNR